MNLSPKAFGLALGILAGVAIFLATLWIAAMSGGNHLIMLKQFYFGYSVSFVGALVGFVYAFIDGFIAGALIAWLYNKFVPAAS
ncbi:MAG: bacteriophage holin [Candidatus Glassbacteria bacterium]